MKLAMGCIERMGLASRHAANFLYVQNDLLKDPQSRLLAYRLALSREKQAGNCASLKAPSTFGAELGMFLANSIAINMTEKDKRVAERRVEEQLKSQFSGNLEQRFSFVANMKNIADAEKEIAGVIDPSLGAESIFASKSARVRDAVDSIIEEQESRAKASWKRLSQEQIYSLLQGTHTTAGDWVFETGELKSLKIESARITGHCVLAEFTLELVGRRAGARRDADPGGRARSDGDVPGRRPPLRRGRPRGGHRVAGAGTRAALALTTAPALTSTSDRVRPPRCRSTTP